MKIAIIGGGINGITSAWKLAANGYKVDLYEEKELLSQTSSSSSKLLHGGIRYLEYGHFGLVRQSLLDRHKWIKLAPQFCKPIKMLMPVYSNSQRSQFTLFFGAYLYRLLAGKYSLGPTSWHSRKNTEQLCPDINFSRLRGAISFYDAQMNEEKLGKWVQDKALQNGVNIFENTPITSFNKKGEIKVNNEVKKYNFIVNATGPWAHSLNLKNDITTNYSLKLIRGSHLIVNKEISNPFIFQELEGKRIVFVLPYLGKTLIGTTEVEHDLSNEIICSDEERNYLMDLYNSKFTDQITKEDIIKEFSGLRPIISKNSKVTFNYIAASRESVLEVNKKVLTIYGGKWTSALSLSDELFLKLKRLDK